MPENKTTLGTSNEGLSGYISFKTGETPAIDARYFVFESEKAIEKAIEEWDSEYTRSDFSTVQHLTVQNGKKRRRAASNNQQSKRD